VRSPIYNRAVGFSAILRAASFCSIFVHSISVHSSISVHAAIRFRSAESRGFPAAHGNLKVNVNVVQLFFNVKDKHGMLIPNLTKNDFDVAEDGKPQTTKYFTAETNLPLRSASDRLQRQPAQRTRYEKEVGGAFLRQILTDKDEAFVIDFDISVDLLQDSRATFTGCRLLSIRQRSMWTTPWSIPGMAADPCRSIIRRERCFTMRSIFPPTHAV